MQKKSKNSFFEGKDFKQSPFKGLVPKFYPPKYQVYSKQETALLKKKLVGAKRILEAGVGIGRLIPALAPLVEEFIGVDTSDFMIRQAKQTAKQYKNVKIKKLDLKNLAKSFPKNYFDVTLCVWNTLGNVESDSEILKELSKVTSGRIFITVYLKGTLTSRKGFYKKLGVGLEKIDETNEIFYTKSGLKSKSYNLKDFKKLIVGTRLKIVDSKVLGGVILWIELKKL